MKKLNFGCGTRTARGWINIDFHSSNSDVQRVNLLKRFPFPDSYFDAAYSSHVLEHFSRTQADHLISEAYRVLAPNGILRIVVPDMEATCREYLRILDSWDGSTCPKRYEWIMLELLDQLTRTTASGDMLTYFDGLRESQDIDLIAYVESRAGSIAHSNSESPSNKLRRLNLRKIYNKLFYMYLHTAKYIFPKHIRSEVMVLTGFGERHKWMYDRLGLAILLRKHGLREIIVQQPNVSAISDFNEDLLDIEPNGAPYKCNSLYLEARKPKLVENKKS